MPPVPPDATHARPRRAPAPPAPFPPPTFPTPPTPQQEFAQFLAQVKQFVLNNAWWIGPAVVVAIVLIIILMWLRARGKFMFLDGVANDRAAVVEPWKRLAPQANSYFRFFLLLALLAIVALVAIGGVAYLLAAAGHPIPAVRPRRDRRPRRRRAAAVRVDDPLRRDQRAARRFSRPADVPAHQPRRPRVARVPRSKSSRGTSGRSCSST